jgi:hypothetical protein
MDGQFNPSPEAHAERATRVAADVLTLDGCQRTPLSQDQSSLALAFEWLANAAARLPIWPLRVASVPVRERRYEPRL